MRSKYLQQVLDKTPKHVDIFVEKYGDLVVRIHEILAEQGLTQHELAERLGKSPSEVSKWLSGNHNLTLRSIAKLEAELGVDLLTVPKTTQFHTAKRGALHFGDIPAVRSKKSTNFTVIKPIAQSDETIRAIA